MSDNNDSNDWTLELIIPALIVMAIFIAFAFIYISANESHINESNITGTLMSHDNLTYIPHYVTLHIVPEEPNLTVIIKREDQSYSVIWTTDDNSEILVECISLKMYKINVRESNYFIYPYDSEYYIVTRSNIK